MELIERELYMRRIRPFIGERGAVKVFTGIRRCGKSAMMELVKRELRRRGIAEDRMVSLNFESRAEEAVRNADAAYAYVKERAQGGRVWLFFDEVQELDGWEKLVNACQIDFDSDIYVTGSNARLLSGELATYLGGRYREIRIYPFSFSEVLELARQSGTEMEERQGFMEYARFGGMPPLWRSALSDEDRLGWLSDIADSIVLKDIAARNGVRSIDQLRRVLDFLLDHMGQVFSAATVTKYLKNERRTISAETLYNYLDHTRAACLVHTVPRENLRGRELLKTQEKIYLADHGFREARLGGNLKNIEQTLKNIVFMELLRRGWNVTVGTAGTREIDFVASRPGARAYVQVCYLLASAETEEPEFGALRASGDDFPKYVISMDEIDRGRDGIRHLNVRDFLLRGELP